MSAPTKSCASRNPPSDSTVRRLQNRSSLYVVDLHLKLDLPHGRLHVSGNGTRCHRAVLLQPSQCIKRMAFGALRGLDVGRGSLPFSSAEARAGRSSSDSSRRRNSEIWNPASPALTVADCTSKTSAASHIRSPTPRFDRPLTPDAMSLIVAATATALINVCEHAQSPLRASRLHVTTQCQAEPSQAPQRSSEVDSFTT